MPGARCTRSLACKIKKHTSVVTTGSPELPGTPARDGFTAYFVISPVIGLSCHRRLRCRKLDASVEASGPHDFAVRISNVRQRCLRVHRIPPRVRDDRDTPLLVGRDGTAYSFDLGQVRTKLFLKMGVDSKSRSPLICPAGWSRSMVDPHGTKDLRST